MTSVQLVETYVALHTTYAMASVQLECTMISVQLVETYVTVHTTYTMTSVQLVETYVALHTKIHHDSRAVSRDICNCSHYNTP